MSQGPSIRIEVCCSFLGAQPIEKEIHPKLRVERTIHSKDHHQRNLIKNKPNQKKTESQVPDTYPHLAPRNQEKPFGLSLSLLEITVGPLHRNLYWQKKCHMSCSNIPKVIHCNPAHPTACASLDLKQVKLQGFFNGEWMEEISPKTWEGNDPTVLTQGGYRYIYISSMNINDIIILGQHKSHKCQQRDLKICDRNHWNRHTHTKG